MNPDNNSTFQVYSFWGFLRVYKIEIPIIQRDYAQGRDDTFEVRTTFAQSLRDSFKEENDPIELDFIYGDVHGGCFRPLDGQQRLTTLFLLHWYIAQLENINILEWQKPMSHFLYETRISSREFCHALVMEFRATADWATPPSEQIRDQPWFSDSWNDDPTISGMLTMLNAIHKVFPTPQRYWDKLTVLDSPIKFSVVFLNDYGLSDELYIKMNARGRPLSLFENFKAVFENRIAYELWEPPELDQLEKFSHHIDNRWTNTLWNLNADKEKPEARVDSPMIRFIKYSLMCSDILSGASQKKLEEKLPEIMNSKSALGLSNFFTKTSFEELTRRLNLLSKTCGILPTLDAPTWLGYAPNQLQAILDNDDPQYRNRLMLYAQFLCADSTTSTSATQDWLRVIRNLQQNMSIENWVAFSSAMQLVDELAQGLPDIYTWLCNNDIKSGASRTQQREEIRKAKILREQPYSKPLLHKLEDLDFCRGRISFPLDFASKDSEIPSTEVLEQIYDVISKYYERANLPTLRRALFTIGDGEFYRYWTNGWLGLFNRPKYCMIKDYEELRGFPYRAEHFSGYFHRLSAQLIESTPEEIIDAFSPDAACPTWRRVLIKHPDLIEKSEQGYFAFDQEGQCYLIPRSRPRNVEELILVSDGIQVAETEVAHA